MQQIPPGAASRSILTDPNFRVPPVPAADRGVAWLRASVARFSTGEEHHRRRALVVELLDGVSPGTLAAEPTAPDEHPVAVLARALGLDASVSLVDDVAQAYQPGTGDEPRADLAVDRLVENLGGSFDEETAARIGLLVQACRATAALIERSRHTPIDEVLRDHPPVPTTKRQAVTPATLGDTSVAPGEIVLVSLTGDSAGAETGDSAFGAGEHRCPGRAHALALARR